LGYVIGIDIGGSITKIAGMENGSLIGCLQVRATDPVASLYGALGKFLTELKIPMTDISEIRITGVGASAVTTPILDIPTRIVDEFYCIGRGGMYTTDLEACVVVSMGTGTALVYANDGTISHIGGTGVGGGTLLGLSGAILNVRDIHNLVQLAVDGDLHMVDLTVGDITTANMPNLPSFVTASNFGKLSELATPSDIALGLFSMVYQSIGMLAVFAARGKGCSSIVFTGNLADTPLCKPALSFIELMFDLRVHIPERAQYVTAIGAALLS